MRPATEEEKQTYSRNPHSGKSWEDDDTIPEPEDTQPPGDTQPE